MALIEIKEFSIHEHADLGAIRDALTALQLQGVKIMTQLEDLDVVVKQINADLVIVLKQGADYIAARDAIDVDLKNQIAALTATAAIDDVAKASLAGDIADALAAADQAKGQLAPPAVPDPVPVA